jgi:hypothetical protein
MSLTALGGGCALVFVPLALLGASALAHANKAVSDGLLSAGVVSVFVIFGVSVAAYIGFQVAFFRDAVKVPGSSQPADIPRVVEASYGIISGEAELTLKMPVRCTAGRLGRCLIEVYAEGIQISKGRDRAEPRWQFAYRDLVQVERIDLEYVGKSGSSHQYFVRLVAAQPRMAFLIGSRWLRNKGALQLAETLQAHQVPELDESFVC